MAAIAHATVRTRVMEALPWLLRKKVLIGEVSHEAARRPAISASAALCSGPQRAWRSRLFEIVCIQIVRPASRIVKQCTLARDAARYACRKAQRPRSRSRGVTNRSLPIWPLLQGRFRALLS